MLSRRAFITASLTVFLAAFCCSGPAAETSAAELQTFEGKAVFERILAKSKKDGWAKLPVGQLMGKIALELEGTPYKSDTLEISPDSELCSANLSSLDCVTFFETTFCLARMLKHGGQTPADLLKEISLTRYRGGEVGDFTSRPHYTSDWLSDNEKKGTVKILGDLPGAEPFTQKINLMSTHPNRQLLTNSALLPKIKEQEGEINKRALTYIPADKVAAVEPLLQTGDIIGLCSNVPGLDISHTGLIFRTADGVAHFMDASSKPAVMKVRIETGPISDTVKSSKRWIGIMVARPLEVH